MLRAADTHDTPSLNIIYLLLAFIENPHPMNFKLSKLVVLVTCACVLLSLSCNQEPETQTTQETIIEKMIQKPEYQSAKWNGKLVVLDSEYCETQDCKALFDNYSHQIQVMTRQDCFMRNIRSYLVIHSLDPLDANIELKSL